MRRSSAVRPLLAGLVVLAMLLSISGILVASGTTVRITSPEAGARVSGTLTVYASIKTDADISYVILAVDDDRPSASNSTPYKFEVDTRELTDGPHRLCVEVYDRYGLLGSSKVITVYVKNGSSAVEVKKEAAASRVATRPAPKPAVRTAAGARADAARTVASAAAVDSAAAVSPAASSRGPMPAPTRAPDGSTPAVPRPSVPETIAAPRLASGALSSAPPRPGTVRAGARGHTVVLNGRPVAFDVAPYIAEGRLQVGFRAMMETVGADVTWTPETRTAKSVKGTLCVELPIGERFARINGTQLPTNTPTVIRQGRTMVAVRVLASAIDSGVYWDGATRTATLSAKQHAIAKHQPAE